MRTNTSEILGNYFIKIFVIFLGLLFIIPSIHKLYNYWDKRTQSLPMQGTVISKPVIGSDLACRPTVTYNDQSGQSHTIKSKINFYWIFAPKQGEVLKVRYFKTAPETAFIDGFYYYIVLPVQFLLMGAYLLYAVFTGRVG